MDIQAALSHLRVYKEWRSGRDDRTLDQTGLTPALIGDSLECLVEKFPQIEKERDRYKALYARAITQRGGYHAEVVRLRRELAAARGPA